MRCLLFDVDGVLVHGYHARAERQRRWDQHLREDFGIDPEAFRERFIRGPFTQEVLPGRLPLVTALERSLPALGYRGSPLTLIGYWLARDSSLNHPLLDLVKRLRGSGRARLYIVTNQEHLRAQHLWSGLGFQHLFEDLFHSARLGALKPEPAFFAAVAAALGPQREPPLLFDDSPAVVEAARRCGWEAALYDELPDAAGHPWVAAALAGAARQ